MIRFMSTEIDALGLHCGNIDRQNHECKSRAVPPNYLTKYLSSYLLTGMTEPITITETELNKHWIRTPRNCKMSRGMSMRDKKAVNVCTKCNVSLHPMCFMAYHVPNSPRPT